MNNSTQQLWNWNEIYKNEKSLKWGLMYPSMYFSTLVCFMFSIIGLLGNFLSFVIWVSKRQRAKTSSAIYLAALALFDLVVITCYIYDNANAFHQLLTGIERVNKIEPGFTFPFFMQCTSLAFQYTDILIVLAFTIERWISVCYPFVKNRICSVKRNILVIGICCLLGSLASIFKSLSKIPGHEYPSDSPLSWAGYVMEILFSNVLTLTTLAFNILLLYELKQLILKSSKLPNRQTDNANGNGFSRAGGCETTYNSSLPKIREEQSGPNFMSTTVMVLLLSFYLIVSNTLAGAMILIDQGQPTPPREFNSSEEAFKDPVFLANYYVLKAFCYTEIIVYSHFVTNFIIYLCTNRSFRKQAKDMFCIICLRCRLLPGSQSQSSQAPVTGRLSLMPNTNTRHDSVDGRVRNRLLNRKSADPPPAGNDHHEHQQLCTNEATDSLAKRPARGRVNRSKLLEGHGLDTLRTSINPES